jgi:hypothetical protein
MVLVLKPLCKNQRRSNPRQKKVVDDRAFAHNEEHSRE